MSLENTSESFLTVRPVEFKYTLRKKNEGCSCQCGEVFVEKWKVDVNEEAKC
jgi:formylmethanofuran dehydrogenase subunit E